MAFSFTPEQTEFRQVLRRYFAEASPPATVATPGSMPVTRHCSRSFTAAACASPKRSV